MSSKRINDAVSKEWKKPGDSEKSAFEEMAKADSERYDREWQ